MPTLRIDHKEYNVTRIGNGAFARVYKDNNDRVFALVDCEKGDYGKESIALWVDQSNPYIPQIVQEHNDVMLSSLSHICFNAYSMPMYTKATGTAKKTAKMLIKLWDNFTAENHLSYRVESHEYMDRGYAFLATLENTIDEQLYNALYDIFESMINYSQSLNFDFHMGNFMQDANGHLILLDVVFDVTAKQGMS